MYIPRYFAVHEVVPPRIFDLRGEKSLELMDDRVLITLDRLRRRHGPMTVNNYYWGGKREWSGLRTPESPYYSSTSQHTFGRAIDCIFKDTTAANVREDIMDFHKYLKKKGLTISGKEAYGLITSIELETSWLHFDVRNCRPLKTYRP